MAKDISDRRSEQRQPSLKYHSVEMKLASLPIYLFKLKEVSSNGASFMVKEDSAILKHLKVAQVLNMRYHADDEKQPSEVYRSEIKHITKALENPHKGHYAVGIRLLERLTPADPQDDLE